MDIGKYKEIKKERREKKRTIKRKVSGEEVIYIFEKILHGWKTIQIFNSIIQQNPNSEITKKMTEKIATGNCKLYESELTKDRFEYYIALRERVYKYNNSTFVHAS
jgi:hypothetical protein